MNMNRNRPTASEKLWEQNGSQGETPTVQILYYFFYDGSRYALTHILKTVIISIIFSYYLIVLKAWPWMLHCKKQILKLNNSTVENKNKNNSIRHSIIIGQTRV